jgi:hypothetical protein
MKRSEQINEIAAALAKAQVEMHNPAFDSQNPHFRSKFASLASVRNAVVPVLAKHGVFLTQELTRSELGMATRTVLMHSSGQWIEYDPLVMPMMKDDAQGAGSATTYGKRYAMQGVAAVVGDEDDDAEAAVDRGRVDPRGDGHKTVNPSERAKFVSSITDILAQDVEEEVHASQIYAIHQQLTKDPDLYIAVGDELAAKKILSKAGFKELVNKGKPKPGMTPNGRAS